MSATDNLALQVALALDDLRLQAAELARLSRGGTIPPARAAGIARGLAGVHDELLGTLFPELLAECRMLADLTPSVPSVPAEHGSTGGPCLEQAALERGERKP